MFRNLVLENISWTDLVKNDVLHRVKEERTVYNKQKEG